MHEGVGDVVVVGVGVDVGGADVVDVVGGAGCNQSVVGAAQRKSPGQGSPRF